MSEEATPPEHPNGTILDSLDRSKSTISQTEYEPGYAYVTTDDTVETIALDEALTAQAHQILDEYAHQSARHIALCLEGEADARALLDSLATHPGLAALPVGIYYPDDGENCQHWRPQLGSATDIEAHYRTALEVFLESYLEDVANDTIPVAELEARFKTWYRNLTGTDAPSRAQIRRLLNRQVRITVRPDDTRVVLDRRWIDCSNVQ